MKITIAIIATLVGLPVAGLGSAMAAPAPRDGWRDPYHRRATPSTRPRRVPPRATPRRAAPPAGPRATTTPSRVRPRTAPRGSTARNTPTPRAPSAAQKNLPARRPVMPPPETPLPVTPYPASTTLYRRQPVAPPRLWHLRLTVQSHSLLIRHTSLNPLKEDDLFSRASLSGGLELNLVDRLVVSADLGWVGGRFTGTVFGTDATEVVAHSLRAGARVGYRLWDSVTPYVRGGFTATWLGARVRTDTQSLGGRDFAPGAYALGGVEFTIRRSWMRRVFGTSNFTMGLVFEAGWVHLGQFDLDGGVDTTGLVDEYRTSLGRLTLQGATINAGLLLSF